MLWTFPQKNAFGNPQDYRELLGVPRVSKVYPTSQVYKQTFPIPEEVFWRQTVNVEIQVD